MVRHKCLNTEVKQYSKKKKTFNQGKNALYLTLLLAQAFTQVIADKIKHNHILGPYQTMCDALKDSRAHRCAERLRSLLSFFGGVGDEGCEVAVGFCFLNTE